MCEWVGGGWGEGWGVGAGWLGGGWGVVGGSDGVTGRGGGGESRFRSNKTVSHANTK